MAMLSNPAFPHLQADNHTITSPADAHYNCVAWALREQTRWWQPGPGFEWLPDDAPADDLSFPVLQKLFLQLGFHDCGLNAALEAGFEKVALYELNAQYTHVARQLPNGLWTSKMGFGPDIQHRSPENLEGPKYGIVRQIMKRPFS